MLPNQPLKLLAAFGVALSCCQGAAVNAAGSCDLLKAAELESALGGKAGGLSGSKLGDADICMGQVGKHKVMIRQGKRAGDARGETENKGLESVRKMGVKVEVKAEGEFTCMTMVPPPEMSQMGFNTTCTVLRSGKVLGVEVAAPSQKEMATMNTVRTLLNKALARL